MYSIFELFFWLSILSLFHTYVVYPLLLRIFASGKENNKILYQDYFEMPAVSIILAIYNEESVISEKIQSVFDSDYPKDKITFYIGSDASTDQSDEIIKSYAKHYPQIHFERFNQRVGKIRIINKLAAQSSDKILVFTDAHAIFSKNALFELIKHFKNKDIHVVGGRMQSTQKTTGNITIQELIYFNNEYKNKFAESKIWGSMIGAFGAFYAVLNDYWLPVPDNYLSDDFYISIMAIKDKGKAIFEPDAIVYENVSGSMAEEYKRKSRIATGNFQNLSVFCQILLSKRFRLAFAFLSHKVLRWFGPLFIILGMISLSFIFLQNILYTILFIIMLLSLIAPIIDFYLGKIRIHVVILRFISHFYYMNIALLTGLFRYMKGVKSNVWEPTKRE